MTWRGGWLRGACVLGVVGLSVTAVAGCGGSEPPGGTAVLEGRWVGQLESGFIPSGSPIVVLDVEHARVGEPVVAHLLFGDGSPPAAPTDPDVGWPPGIDPLMSGLPLADGFEYAADGTRTGDALDLDVAVTALWAPWCALQTAYQIAPGSDEAQCLPNRPWTATTFECHLNADASSPEEPVDCFKLTLCRRVRVCACTDPGGCTPGSENLTMSFDIEFDGDTATGLITWTRETMPAGTARVSLTRQ